MPVEIRRFTTRRGDCAVCQSPTPKKVLGWLDEPLAPCPDCGGPLTEVLFHVVRAHAVHGDEMERTHEHGVCYPDGRPRRFTSKEELRRAEKAAGVRRLERGEKFEGDARAERRAEAIKAQRRAAAL